MNVLRSQTTKRRYVRHSFCRAWEEKFFRQRVEEIYNFFQRHKWLLWTLFGVTFIAFVLLGLQCKLEENIFKLLPKTDTERTESLAFTNLRLKDKIMVQVVSKDSTALDRC